MRVQCSGRSLLARNERGERWREGKLMNNGLLSPALSSFLGRRGRREALLRSSKLLAEQYWSQTRDRKSRARWSRKLGGDDDAGTKRFKSRAQIRLVPC